MHIFKIVVALLLGYCWLTNNDQVQAFDESIFEIKIYKILSDKKSLYGLSYYQ